VTSRPALLLVDLQNDYLDGSPLEPPSASVVAGAAELLSGFRELGLPVVHVWTLIAPDGRNRMPHWIRADRWLCVQGTPGARPPPAVAPRDGETVLAKPFFSAFGCRELEPLLRRLGIDTVVVAGVHTHGCVRASAVDAYQAGFEVWVAGNAVGSYDPLHAATTRAHLDRRVCTFVESAEILRRFRLPASTRDTAPDDVALPLGWVDGGPRGGDERHPRVGRRSPSDWSRCIATVPLAQDADISLAVSIAADRQAAWQDRLPAARASVLEEWAGYLGRRRPEIVGLLVEEIGKPRRDADAEVDFALALLAATIRSVREGGSRTIRERVHVRRRALGTVAVVTPWNNPLAIPVGKIGPALGWGNTVVWKPAIESPRIALILVQTLEEAGLPAGCLNLLFGEAATAQALMAERQVAAVTFTGSQSAGRQVAAICAIHGKPLQAELGGNNAALISVHCEIDEVAETLARAAFSFAGQRCTAIRRLIVDHRVAERFNLAFLDAVEGLRLGHPGDPDTQIGPLVSREQRRRIGDTVDLAIREGGTLMHGGRAPPGYEKGCWFEPTVLSGMDDSAAVVREESFGPVVVLSEVADFEEGLRRVNGVEQGLLAALFSTDPAERRSFLRGAQAGILRINDRGFAIEPEAPFGGWKASGLGLPEHGPWDREFHTRVQTVYGDRPPR
jgi:alpha-ketoglutaric semialdehyde dehydrogenase